MQILNPMSDFDPSEPCLLHDLVNNRIVAWSPDFEESYEADSQEVKPGVVSYAGLLFDGWLEIEPATIH